MRARQYSEEQRLFIAKQLAVRVAGIATKLYHPNEIWTTGNSFPQSSTTRDVWSTRRRHLLYCRFGLAIGSSDGVEISVTLLYSASSGRPAIVFSVARAYLLSWRCSVQAPRSPAAGQRVRLSAVARG